MEPPPDVPKEPPSNGWARLLPLGMVVAMGGMTALYLTSGAASSRSPMFLFLPVMMLVSVLGSMAHQSRGVRRGGELDQDRRTYLRYLDALDDGLARTAQRQHASLHRRHPDPSAAWTLVGGARMWERRPGDDDFCRVRVGVGTRPLATALALPEPGPIDSRDPVTAGALARLVADRSTVASLPVTVDLLARPLIRVEGPSDEARVVVRAMLCQVAVLHGPDVVVISVVADDECEWDWVKWLPHHRSLGPPETGAHRVIVVENDAFAEDFDHPRNRTTVLLLDGSAAGDGPRLDLADGAVLERPDTLTRERAVLCARRLARYSSVTAPGDGPPDWAGLLGIADPAHLDPLLTWRPLEARRRLRVAVGIGDHGEPVELDLMEAASGGMGPHGLCVGATGSGKSEFLRTLALGLVATHPPEELNLVLVDFKGGATFLGFEQLRHVAAVVTNLSEEEHLVARMRDALAGEMTRRQRVLRSAGNVLNVGEYQAARARGAELPALPALFIIVDEFSELLSQHPDFADLFVAVGRLGRSLGIHLLLASQRLDEGRLRGLETHLSYRICLKTFSASESRAVLGTADAYELPAAPGAAYLKTVSGELVRFQTAFVSGGIPAPAPTLEPAPAVFTAADVGRASTQPARAGGSRSLLDVVIDGLSAHGTAAHQVWLPPLEDGPGLGDLLADVGPAGAPLVLPIGLVDNPFAQRRDPLMVDLRGSGGNVAIVGGPRLGKTTALRTLILGLAATHGPEDVAIHALDFGGGALSALALLPHVGTVAGRFERELARRIVVHVQGLVRRRETQRRRGEAETGGDVFLVVDGWAVVRQEFDGMEEAITSIATQGLSVGVHVVVAASRWADLRPALKDQLGTRIELRLGDPADSEMDRKRARLLADRPAGHGITREGLEFVIAVPRLTGAPEISSPVSSLRADAAALAARHPGRSAPAVELLPARFRHADVVAQGVAGVVLGLGEDDLRPVVVDFATLPHLLILGDTECGKTATLRTLCREIVRNHGPDEARILVVDFRRTMLGVVETEHLFGYAMSTASAESAMVRAVDSLSARLPGDGVTQLQLRDRSWWSGPEVYVVVDDYDLVSGASGNPLSPLLDLLPHARDLGLHLVIARRSGGAARAMFDPVLTRLRDLGCTGLMMSAGPEEGVLLGSVRPSPLPAGRGTLIRRGQHDQLVQVAWTDPP